MILRKSKVCSDMGYEITDEIDGAVWFFITPAPLGRMLNLEFSEIWEL